ncbi:MAG: hypothetical protein PHG05_01390 [Candidatus Nanoarchaeia archaeon]|nr:hypothetical protein [Candidatus Nanoarchaeia archaeon]
MSVMNLLGKKAEIHWDTIGKILIVLVVLVIMILVYLIFKDKMVEVIEKFKDML